MRKSEYQTALVVYLDILGFRELIQQSVSDPLKVYDILSALRTVKEHTSESIQFDDDGHKPPPSIFRAFNFSDLTVRATLTEPTTFIEILNWEFIYLSSIQARLACRDGLLLRGGISHGSISVQPEEFWGDDILFGPALVHSYELESKKAIYPRIIIDKELIELASKEADTFWTQSIAEADDGTHFIHYLSPLALGWLQPASVFNDPNVTMEQHKQTIETKLTEFKSHPFNDRIAEKLTWLARYHNSVVDELRKMDPDGRASALLIPEDLFSS
jgi:hypothetical protein